jgi:hypothetical protein
MEEVTMSQEPHLTERQRFWFEHLRACGSGSLKEYAQTHGLDLRALYDAKARLKRKGALASNTPARLVRVERTPHRLVDPAYCRVHLANGTAVELSCAPQDWARLFETVASLP